jgi:uroporphyrinogen-III synthase
MENKTTLLSTKSIFKTILDDNFVVDCYDFIKTSVERVDEKILFDQIIFTSKNGVKFAFSQYNFSCFQGKVFYCVGNETANEIKKNGFKPIFIEQTATQLAQKLISLSGKNFTYFCGNLHLDNLPHFLLENQKNLQKIVVYKTEQTPYKLNKNYEAYLFYSPSGVDSFFRLNSIHSKATIFAIGKTTANYVKNKTKNKIIIPPEFSLESMLMTIKKYYKYE